MKNKILSIAVVVIMLTQMSPFVSMTANADEIAPTTITIEINGTYNSDDNTISTSAIVCTGASLSLAVNKYTAGNPSIEKLKITAGKFTVSDWENISFLNSLKKLEHFEIAEDVSVDPMPNGDNTSKPIFSNAITSVKIPQETPIGNNAFSYCSSLIKVSIPSATAIGYTAFMGCGSLATVDFPNVTNIGSTGFSNCKALTTVKFDKVETIAGSSFMNCTSLASIYFPVTKDIGDRSFQNCSSLTNVEFPQAVTIGGLAFNICTALTTVTFPAVRAIGTGAFDTCTSLTAVDFPIATKISEQQFQGLRALREVNFPKLEIIPMGAFWNCGELATVNFPEVITIGEKAFNNCVGLEEVKFEVATKMMKNSFSQCVALKKAYFPKLESIPYQAFNNCNTLAIVDFSEAKTIGEYAFNNCWALTTVTFPSVTAINTRAFDNCTSLTAVDFPMATEIRESAFNYCRELISADFPNAESFGSQAFQNSNKLGTLKLGATPPAVTADSFLNTPKTNPLVLLDAEGKVLIGNALTAVQNAYKAVDDGDTSVNDDLWYGWTIMNLPEATYKVIGTVQDSLNSNISDAAVKLMKGNTQVGTENIITNSAGEFTITDVPNGTYNLVVSKAGITVTSLVVVNSLDNNLTSAILLPSGKTSSVVEISGSETPGIVVGNLNGQFSSPANDDNKGVTTGDNTVVASGGSVEIKFIAEKKMEEDASNSGDIKLKAQSNGKTVNTFLNLMVLKTVTTTTGAVTTTTLSGLQKLIEIVIPLGLEMQGQTEYVIYRYHGAEVDTITTTANADGEYIVVNEDNTITLYAKKFSTYAIGYKSTAVSPPPSGGGGGSGSNNSINSNKENNYSESSGVLITQPVNGPGIPYYIKDGNKVYIGFSALSGDKYKYIVPNGATVEFEDNSKNFLDNNLEWSKTSIDFVTQREIFLGVNQNIFGHDETMTRGMFVTVMGRLYERSYGGISIGDTFSDVDLEAYYGKYVAWANKNGVIKGVGEDKFLPNERVTREQMAVIILNFARFLENADFAQGSLEYIDKEEISYWATEGAKYCQETQVITGRSGGQFAPQESATRAEVAVVVERFIKNNLK